MMIGSKLSGLGGWGGGGGGVPWPISTQNDVVNRNVVKVLQPFLFVLVDLSCYVAISC